MADSTLLAIFLGILEGLTEFIPVSSTGHLLLAGHFLGFESNGKTFEVVIQLGAVLAILTVYSGKLFGVVRDAPHDPSARRFILAVVLAFLPAAFVGVLLRDFIKGVLFETPLLISVSLIVGGVILLIVDRRAPEPRHHDAFKLPIKTAFLIGVAQCVAMIPGVSRSGATIVAGLMLGASRRTAAEFSFFLSMPTMAGAFAYDLFASRNDLDWSALSEILIGFGVAFVTAVLVVRWVLDFVARNGFSFFGWWRIVVGVASLILLFSIG